MRKVESNEILGHPKQASQNNISNNYHTSPNLAFSEYNVVSNFQNGWNSKSEISSIGSNVEKTENFHGTSNVGRHNSVSKLGQVFEKSSSVRNSPTNFNRNLAKFDFEAESKPKPIFGRRLDRQISKSMDSGLAANIHATAKFAAPGQSLWKLQNKFNEWDE